MGNSFTGDSGLKDIFKSKIFIDVRTPYVIGVIEIHIIIKFISCSNKINRQHLVDNQTVDKN